MNDKRWHSVTRTLQQLNADQQRTRADNVPLNLDGSTLLLVKHGTEPVREYIYGETPRLTKAGELSGYAVSPLDEQPDLPDAIQSSAHPLIPFRARLNAKNSMEALRSDAGEIRKSVEALMPEDSYVSVTIRRKGLFEQKRVRNWVNDERSYDDDSNPLLSEAAMCARVSAGCADRADARDLAVGVGRALCPLMDSMSYHDSHPKLGLFAASLAAIPLTLIAALAPQVTPLIAAAAAVGLIIAAVLADMLVSVAKFSLPAPVRLGVALASAYILMLALPIPVWCVIIPIVLAVASGLRWWRWTAWDDIMQRPRHYWGFTKERRADESDSETRGGMKDYRRRVTGYGTQRTTLVLAPLTTMSLYTPTQSGGALQQQLHPVPEPLSKGGVYLGKDQTGRPCYVLPDQLYGCVAILGAAGRGKSVLTHGFMQWAVAHRDDSDPRDWGRDTRIIDFEMKDDSGVRVMDRYRRNKWPYDPRHPDVNRENKSRQGRTISLADPNSPRIDMLGMDDGLNARETAASIAATMQHAFESGDILNDSLDIIAAAMTIAVAVQRYLDNHPTDDGTNPIIQRMHQFEQKYPGAGQAEPQRSPIGWALMALAGSDGQASSARALGHVCRSLALETKDEDMTLAAKAAEQLYGSTDDNAHKLSDQRILDRTNASRNKVRQFMDCEHVFTSRPGRRSITWDMVLAHPGDYHFVLCDRRTPNGMMRLPDRMNRILGKWMLYRMWNTVKRNCQNWREQGKHTMFVCDELSMLANTDDTILREMKDQGRSFGWFTVFATQYPEQLPHLLLTSFMGYNTFCTFDNSDPDMAMLTARRLAGVEGDGWDASAVQNLPMFTAAVRTRAGSQLQPAFIVNVENFDRIV